VIHAGELYRRARPPCQGDERARGGKATRDLARERTEIAAVLRATELAGQWLEEDHRRPRRQRHTARQVFDRLRTEHGFSGSYMTVRKGRRRSLNPTRKLNTGTPATASRMSPRSAQLPQRRLRSR